MAVIVELELSKRRELADLAAHLVERERAVQRLQLIGQAEGRLAQLELIEAAA